MLTAALTASVFLGGCGGGSSTVTEKPSDESTVTESSGDEALSDDSKSAQNTKESVKKKSLSGQSGADSLPDESLTDTGISDAEAAELKKAEEEKQKEEAAKQAEAQAAADAEILTHVSGIKHFTTVEGKHPDVMAGVAWDDTIAEVTTNTEEINWDKPGKYTLVYTITTKDGRTVESPIEIEVYLDLEHYLYGMEGSVYIPVNGTFDPMEHIVTEPEIETIEPDVSALDTTKEGEYLISYRLTAPGGRFQTAVRKVTVGEEPQTAEYGTGTTYVESVEGYSTVTSLGLWRLTAYMDTPADQGPYVGQTASGAPLVAGRTVAVSAATCERLGLVFGDRLMVDGHVYVLEDHGGSAMYDSDWLDIYVDNEADEYSDAYNRYAEVYLLR